MNIKSILTTAALLIAFAVTSQAQYTVVRVIEAYKDKMSEIQIVYDNGEIEVFELKKISSTGFGSAFETENSLSNIKLIAETLNKIKSKGYKLIGSSTGAGGIGDTGFSMQTYIFEKED